MVASNVGGNPEAIVEGQTGLLFDPRRPEDLAAKIMALLNNEDLLRYMRVESRKRAEDVFSTTKMIDMYDKLYVQLLESKRAAYLFRVDLERRANALSTSESKHETK